MFILRPSEKSDATTTTHLNDDDNGRVLGPFSPGDYIADMVTMGAKSKEKQISVKIESGKTKDLCTDFLPFSY